MKTENAVATFVLAIFGTPAILFFDAVLSGWAISILWKWFIFPVFDLRIISIPEAIGISLIIAHLTHQTPTNKDGRDHPFLSSILTSMLKPLCAVCIGWIVKLFI